MAKRMSIEELRSPDAVIRFSDRAATFIVGQQKYFLGAAVVLVIAVSIIATFFVVNANREFDASYDLAIASAVAKGEGDPTKPPPAQNQAPKRTKENIEKALPLLEGVEKKFPGTLHGQLAILSEAEALTEAKKDPVKKYLSFISVTTNPNLKDSATLSLAYYYINSGKKAEASKLLEGKYQRKESPFRKQLKLAYSEALNVKGSEAKALAILNELYVDETDEKTREDLMARMRAIKASKNELL